MKRPWIKYPVVFAALIAAYMLFALVANLLPNAPIIRHTACTIAEDDLQSDFWFVYSYRPAYYLDNFTDALIINQACNGGSDHLLTSMMLNPRSDNGESQCSSLKSIIAGDTTLHTVHYGRYWHGSTFLMRFLLSFWDYPSLRILFYLISSVLLAWVAAALFLRVGKAVALFFALSLAFVNCFMMQNSIQFLPVLLIALAATLWVAYRVQRPEQMVLLLFVSGSLTAFFDLLTCPVMTWGLPLGVYLMKRHRHPDGSSWLRQLGTWTVASVMWAVGYGATWIAKWGIATILTGENVIRDGASQFAIRAGANIDYSRIDAVTNNLSLIPWDYVIWILILMGILLLWRFKRKGSGTALLCLLTAVPPLLWYLVTADHSYLHNWFTYRSLSVCLMAIFFALTALVDWQRLKQLRIKH